MTDHYDMIVVGAGIIGTCTAYHAQKAGLKTLLIEQYSLGHGFGSSPGKSRIIRYAHKDPRYLPLVKDTFEQIAELEEKRGEKLWVQTGLVWIARQSEIDNVSKHLADFGCDYELLTNEEVEIRYPHLKYDSSWAGMVDPMGGILYADKWLEAFQDEFRQLGGTILENSPVESFEDGEVVSVRTSLGEFTADKAVFALGSWINTLFPDISAKSQNELVDVAYWAPKNEEDAHLTEPEKYPALVVNGDGIGWYSLPSVEYKGAVKFAFHEGQPFELGDEAAELDPKYVDAIRAHIREHLPFLEADNGPWKVDRCKYENSPDCNYVVGFAPGSTKIQVAAFMSGTGFKNGPSLGRAIIQQALGEKPFADISTFSLDRFWNNKLRSDFRCS